MTWFISSATCRATWSVRRLCNWLASAVGMPGRTTGFDPTLPRDAMDCRQAGQERSHQSDRTAERTRTHADADTDTRAHTHAQTHMPARAEPTQSVVATCK
eukprot:4027802-Alexandrium_andersonii.AAC.1